MAGGGRGRGRRMMTFSVEAIGINRGESLPPSIQQPTALFPVMEQKPLPLAGGEEAEYLLALKQEFRGAMKTLPCYIQPATTHTDVERYSDKYQRSEQPEAPPTWSSDCNKFPRELRTCSKRPRPHNKPEAALKKKRSQQKEEVLLRLETLEKKEERGNSEGEEEEEEGSAEEKKKKQEEEEAEGEEEYDEEEFEEETDYVMSYFDNGDDFAGDSDDNMDEAIY